MSPEKRVELLNHYLVLLKLIRQLYLNETQLIWSFLPYE